MAIKFTNTPERPVEPKTGKGRSIKKDAKSTEENLEMELNDTDSKGKASK